MSKPRLILHVGHSKCGSTSIQRFLVANRAKLAQQDIYIFNSDLKASADTPFRGLPNSVIANKNNWPQAVEAVISAARSGGPQDTFILTAECLSQPSKVQFITSFIDIFDTKVIHYIRRQDEWCYSAWKQWRLKQGKTLSEWVEFCTDRTFPRFIDTFRSYDAAGVDSGNYRMKILDSRFLLAGDLLQDFCYEAQIEAKDFEQPSQTANPGIDRALLEVLRSANFMFQDQHDNAPFHWLIANFSDNVTRRRGRLSSTQSQRILEAHYESNKKLCDLFFSDRAKALWDVFGPEKDKDLAEDEPDAPTARRVNELERQIEDTRRALGYLLEFMMRLKPRDVAEDEQTKSDVFDEHEFGCTEGAKRQLIDKND